MGVLLDKEHIRYAASCGPTTSGSCPTQKNHLQQMLWDLIREAEKWDLARWTSTYDSEEKSDLSIDIKTGRHRCHLKRNS